MAKQVPGCFSEVKLSRIQEIFIHPQAAGTLTQGGSGSDSQRSKFINKAEFNAPANPTDIVPSIIFDNDK
jgi:hypothetical protein